jgi:hypothetical protein
VQAILVVARACDVDPGKKISMNEILTGRGGGIGVPATVQC